MALYTLEMTDFRYQNYNASYVSEPTTTITHL